MKKKLKKTNFFDIHLDMKFDDGTKKCETPLTEKLREKTTRIEFHFSIVLLKKIEVDDKKIITECTLFHSSSFDFFLSSSHAIFMTFASVTVYDFWRLNLFSPRKFHFNFKSSFFISRAIKPNEMRKKVLVLRSGKTQIVATVADKKLFLSLSS